MHRIDTPTAQIDKFGQGKNGFTNGDRTTGRRATELNSDMWDAVQEEIANAIEGAGIELDKSEHNQLYLAIQKAIKDKGFLEKNKNLSDVADKEDSRKNLGLGTAATKNVGTADGNVMAVGAFGLGVGPQHKADAFSNIAQIYRLSNTSTGTPGNSTYGVICLPCSGEPSSTYLAASNNGEFHVGRSFAPSAGITWNRVYTTAFKPTAQDVGALPLTGGTLSGDLGVGGLDYIRKTGFYSFQNSAGNWRQTNGLRIQGFGDQFADIYFSELLGQYASLSMHARSGGRDAWIEFRHTGEFRINGSEVAPVGIPQPWPQETPPAGWLKCNGQAFDRSLYPLLASAYPAGVLPDLRGEFIRAWDDGRGVDSGRSILSFESDALQDHGHKAIRLRNLGGGGGQTAIPDGGSNFTNDLDLINGVSNHDYNGGTPRIAGETRPRNIAFNYIVRAA
ncbi:phage tail protein [Serratia marcescens]|uniref:phage tail protein n=1 Tax=Serratia marcescens TaxID=615 RepID=UPI001EF84FC5|nr:phage tail protein [Serratia marcescens]